MSQLVRRIVCFILVGLLVSQTACKAETGVLYEKKSKYNHITVRQDEDGVRRLVFEDGATQSAVRVSDPDELVLGYAKAIMSGLAFVPEPKRILIVGLGGGTMPRCLRRLYPQLQIDVAELDPDVADVARRFFFFKEDARMKVYIGDGRKFIQETSNRYDIIFLDAYGSDNIPYALATREFLVFVRNALTDGGIVVSNVWSSYSNRLYHSMLKTYMDVYADVRIVQAADSGNQIFIAAPRKMPQTRRDLSATARELQRTRRLGYNLAMIITSGYEDPGELPAGARVLLDADAPKE